MRQRSEDIAYTDMLKNISRSLNVKFMIDYDAQDIDLVLRNTTILWHLTGINANGDPASEEHFGISVANAMSYGIVPVVFSGGAMPEIVDHGTNGFLCESHSCFVRTTISLISNEDQIRGLRENAINKAKKFSEEHFTESARTLVHKALLGKIFRLFVRSTSPIVNSRRFRIQQKSDKLILMVESRNHFAMEYVMKNAIFHLGKGWSATLFHGNVNQDLAIHISKSIKHLKLVHLDIDNIDIQYLNFLLTSRSFWEQFAHIDRILFIQTDGILLHGKISPFMKYDYVGAPWHFENELLRNLWSSSFQGVGNGGMSLRNPRALLEILSTHPNISGPEDLFFASQMAMRGHFNIPSRMIAYQFSIETPCPDAQSDESFPVMLHAAWYYFPEQSIHNMLQSSVCGHL